MVAPSDEFVFLPLGGVGEIGMNLALYGFGMGKARKWLVVDVGVAFGDETLPGIELIMADISFLESVRKDVVGIVLTHGHEDHYGALVDLWPKIGAKVHATPFTAGLIEAKRLSEPGAPEIPVVVVPVGATIELGPFRIEFVSVSHSIPESQALAITTALGTIIHTGDWKLDPTPLVGAPTDIERFKALGAAGVKALICDSTNALRDGISPSEADVAKVLAELVAAAPKRVCVTAFASNVARVRSVAEAAIAAGREVVIGGRAMQRTLAVAREQGMLGNLPDFHGPQAFQYMPREKVCAILTGSQGEPRAALARIAHEEHPDFKLAEGDQVIFSSRPIPGNEKAINAVINGLVKQGVEIITDRTHLVHVSGHPRRDELAQLYGWVKPESAVPVHGEALHLHEHARLARKLGVANVVEAMNGSLVRLAPGPTAIVDTVEAGRLYKDGLVLVPAAEKTVTERRRLAWNGIVSVAFAFNGKGDLVGEPQIEITGLPPKDRGGNSFLDIVSDAVEEAIEALPRGKRRDPDYVEDMIAKSVRGAVSRLWGKKPVCHVLMVGV